DDEFIDDGTSDALKNQSFDDFTKVNEDNSNKDEFNNSDKVLFTKRFNSMDDRRKWKLKSGNFVENILYDLGSFTQEELKEIIETTTSPQELQIEDDLLNYIDTFAKDSTKDIREALYAPHPKFCREYDPFKDFAYEHVRTTVSDWVRLLEMQPNPLSLRDFPESEKAGIASSDRKNRNRGLSGINKMRRKIIGKKGDGYLREFGSTITDWAASEVGHKWDGEKGTKLLKECGLSLPKNLKDIFISLSRKINFCEEKIRKIRVPGFILSGAVLIKIILDCPNGYVCRITRDSPLEIYADVSQFNKTLDALISIIYAKIMKSMEVVNGAFSNDNNVNRWKNSGRKPQEIIIPDCHQTPKKGKKGKKGRS
ncbi:10176_t:CDS:2, partial [Gigaspora margarita]